MHLAFDRAFRLDEHVIANRQIALSDLAIINRIEEADPDFGLTFPATGEMVHLRLTIGGAVRDGLATSFSTALNRAAWLFGIGRYLDFRPSLAFASDSELTPESLTVFQEWLTAQGAEDPLLRTAEDHGAVIRQLPSNGVKVTRPDFTRITDLQAQKEAIAAWLKAHHYANDKAELAELVMALKLAGQTFEQLGPGAFLSALALESERKWPERERDLDF